MKKKRKVCEALKLFEAQIKNNEAVSFFELKEQYGFFKKSL
jgi:hypothetical protein